MVLSQSDYIIVHDLPCWQTMHGLIHNYADLIGTPFGLALSAAVSLT